jgi:glycosyltransferase involved in cell wall biosynthesis
LPQLRTLFLSHGYRFACITDHSQDISEAVFETFVGECQSLSDDEFLFVPGLEYSCDNYVHILGIGIRHISSRTDPTAVIDHIHSENGVAVLAHPTKSHLNPTDKWINRLDGVEIWNAGADGRFLPQRHSVELVGDLKSGAKHLAVYFGMDFHAGFQDMAIVVNSDFLRVDGILAALRERDFRCTSLLLNMPSSGTMPRWKCSAVFMARHLLNGLRFLRDRIRPPDPSIRILHLIETTGPGGAETVLLNLTKCLDHARFSSQVIVTGTGWLHKSLVTEGIPVSVIGSKRAADLGFILKVIARVLATRTELIHAHLDGMNFYACLIGFLTRKPVICTYHGAITGWHDRSLKNRLKFWVVRTLSSNVVAVSQFLKQELEKTWRFPESKTVVIYNGVDFSRFVPGSAPGRLRTELGLPTDVKLVGMIGNIRPAKGHEFFIQCASIVTKELPGCHFLIVGQGDEVQMSKIQRQISDLGLQSQVLLTGFRGDVADVLQNLDVFALSSITEGLSIATIEAMGCGTPVVATDCGGPGEIISDGKTGFLVPPRDPEAMADRLLFLLKNADFASQMGQAARQAVEAKFGLHNQMKSYESLYRRTHKRIRVT